MKLYKPLEDLICTNIMQRGVGNVNPMKMAKCIMELERIKGIRQGSAGNPDQKIFGGVTQEDIAKELGVSVRTLQNLKNLTPFPLNFKTLFLMEQLNILQH